MFNRKEYMKKYHKKYYRDNREKELKRVKLYCENNSDKIKQYKKRYYKKNIEKIKELYKQWHKDNREKHIKNAIQWNKDNPEKRKKINQKWAKNNSEKIKENHKIYMNNKYKTNPKFNLNRKISNAIWHSLKENKAGRKWETLVGYTLDNLIKQLKKTIPENYLWQDLFNGKLQIDHKIPKSVFNFDTYKDTDFKRCWTLKNLRLLPARENLNKSNKLD